MDPTTIANILNLIAKGVQVAEILIDAGQDALPALKVVWGLATGANAGTVTQDEIDAGEKTLDGLLAEFDLPLPFDDTE